MEVLTFSYKGQEINVTNRNGFVAYTVNMKGETYGQKIPVSRKQTEIISATALLIINAIETIDAINANE